MAYIIILFLLKKIYDESESFILKNELSIIQSIMKYTQMTILSKANVKNICKKKYSRLKPDGLVFVDPAMADHGEFYNGFDRDFKDKMDELCKIGDYVLPNTKETCYLFHLNHISFIIILC